MLRAYARKAVTILLIFTLGSIGLHGVAHAELIGTQTVMELNGRQQNVGRVNRVLAQESVRAQLVAMGVEPAEVQDRVAALSDQELQHLNGELDNLPAGGVLALIGAVFVVLLILELVGVTNIFHGY